MPHVSYDMPRGAKRIEVIQTRTVEGATKTSTHDLPLYDLAGHTDILFDASKSMARRMLYFNIALNRLGTDYQVESPLFINRRRIKRDPRWNQEMYDVAAAHGVDVPDPLASISSINFEAGMGGGVWVGPGQKLMTTDTPETALMPNPVVARAEGPEPYRISQERFDAVQRLYDRAVTVMADGNHFNGVIWDPVGLDATDIKAWSNAKAPITGPDGVFWAVSDDRWYNPKLIRAKDGSAASAEDVIPRCLCHYALIYFNDVLRDADVLTEDTVCYDSNFQGSISFGTDDTWPLFELDLYPMDGLN